MSWTSERHNSRIGLLVSCVPAPPAAWRGYLRAYMWRGSLWLLPICRLHLRNSPNFWDQGGWSSTSVLAGRPFHFNYESNLLKCLFLVDLPSMVAAIALDFAVGALLKVIRVGSFVGSYFGAGVMLLSGTFEWLALGKLFAGWMEQKQRGRWVLERHDRYWRPALSSSYSSPSSPRR